MAVVLYDLRQETEETGYLRHVNAMLREHRPEYIARYGMIGSSAWWDLFSQGRLSRTILAGVISHTGPMVDEFGESTDIVRIETDRQKVDYRRDGIWQDSRVSVGVWVAIERVKAMVIGAHGPVTTLVDVRISLLD